MRFAESGRRSGWGKLATWVTLIAIFSGIAYADRATSGNPPNGWQPSHAAAFAFNFFVIAVVAPVVEELTFRGLGFSLLQRFGTPVAIIGTGLAFGAWHGLVQALPILIVFGAGLAWIRAR